MHHIFFGTVFLFCFLSGSAQKTDTLSIAGLLHPVEVIRDNWGINHIYAASEADLFFAQGYCAASDRLFQFEIWRRQATGTLAEILGEEELQRDIGGRLFAYRGDIEKELAHYHPRGRSIITSFVDGVNAYIRSCLSRPELLPIEFKMLGIVPGYWTPEVVVSRHQGIRSNALQELNLARAVARVGEKKVRELVWFHPNQPDLTLDPTIDTAILFQDILRLYQEVNKEISFKKENGIASAYPEGSNNWVISGSKTASGYPILANDPHRKIAVPSLRYIVHLSAPGWDVIGGGEPMIPGVSIGHNPYGAWGLTIFETDAEDIYFYELNPSNQLQYRYKGEWKDMEVVKETFRIRNRKDTLVNLYFTHHGPVTYIDRNNNKAVAIRCGWLEPGGAPYLSSLRMDQSQNWESFRDACSYNNIPGENMIWADKKGNIGWQAVGITPIRTTHSGMVPVPGNGDYEWQGFLPIKERPHLFNPASGFFATANQQVTPTDYPRIGTLAYTWADAFRGDRVNEVLKVRARATIPESMKLQNDYTSLPARELVPKLRGIAFNDPFMELLKQKLQQWDYVLDRGSMEAGIYVMWEREITAEARNRFVPPSIAPYIYLQFTTILKWLNEPTLVFGGEPKKERDAFLHDCFLSAMDKMKKKVGSDISRWQYGQTSFKHVSIRHPLSHWVDTALRKQLDFGPIARGGYGLTPGATGMADNQSAGASFRFITDLSDWDKAIMTNTPGQSGDPASPFYGNLFTDWANDRYFPAFYSKEKIRMNVYEQKQLIPSR